PCQGTFLNARARQAAIARTPSRTRSTAQACRLPRKVRPRRGGSRSSCGRSSFTGGRSKNLPDAVSRGETSAMDLPETHYTRSGEVAIAYGTAGHGPFDVVFATLFSHVELGWSMANHHGEIPRRLASFARLIQFDRRGIGMSDQVVGGAFEA